MPHFKSWWRQSEPNVSVSFLRKAREGLSDMDPPPFVKFGRSVRYRRADLDDWLDQFPAYRHQGEL